ncbi:hypothetical protein SDC9_70215 [bioreactor metagenome]|uniref:Uncharacterized protein n=1 Tax=bioreactor metagenome TaxID=1076179 RepID=A0A644Y728_9ZZZZ
MGIGYCKYKKRSYDEAVRYFEKAIENGYLANDVNELLRWAKSPQ